MLFSLAEKSMSKLTPFIGQLYFIFLLCWMYSTVSVSSLWTALGLSQDKKSVSIKRHYSLYEMTMSILALGTAIFKLQDRREITLKLQEI